MPTQVNFYKEKLDKIQGLYTEWNKKNPQLQAYVDELKNSNDYFTKQDEILSDVVGVYQLLREFKKLNEKNKKNQEIKNAFNKVKLLFDDILKESIKPENLAYFASNDKEFHDHIESFYIMVIKPYKGIHTEFEAGIESAYELVDFFEKGLAALQTYEDYVKQAPSVDPERSRLLGEIQFYQERLNRVDRFKDVKKTEEAVETAVGRVSKEVNEFKNLNEILILLTDILSNEAVTFWNTQRKIGGEEVKGSVKVPTGVGQMMNIDPQGKSNIEVLENCIKIAKSRDNSGIFGGASAGRTAATKEFYNILKGIDLNELNNDKKVNDVVKQLLNFKAKHPDIQPKPRQFKGIESKG